MGFLFFADFAANSFVQKMNSIAYPDKTWSWIEYADSWGFGLKRDKPFTISDGGRVFSDSGELKWRKLKPDLWRAVFIGNSIWSGVEDMNDGSHLLTELESSKHQQVLWGDFQPKINKWVELRIPHRFDYPVEASENVCLTAEVWRSKKDGYIHFQRYCNVKPMEEG